MNNKILSFVLIAGIATTWFAGISAANTGTTLTDMKSGFEEWVQKITGKWKGFKNLSEDEKLALESMTDEERKAFFTAKKAEKKAQKEAIKSVVDKLLAWEPLTASEEATRLEALAKIEERSDKRSKPGAEIIAKILAGDELTSEELTQLESMQEKRAEREAQREAIKTLRDKVDAGENLTDEEQAFLDQVKSERKWKKWGKWNRGER